MRTSDALALVAGAKIEHKQYGVCTVVNVMLGYGQSFFGVVMNPDTHESRELLAQHCGVDGRLLEASVKMISLVKDAPKLFSQKK